MEDTSRYGRVLVDRDVVVGFLEKQDGSGRGLIHAGVYLLEHNLLSERALGEVFSLERDYLPPRLAVLEPAASRTAGPFIDIRVTEDYERAQHYHSVQVVDFPSAVEFKVLGAYRCNLGRS